MFNEYYISNLHICNIVADVTSIIETTSSVIDIFTGIVLIVGGFWGVAFLKSLKEKSINAIFGYYTMLKVRINFFIKTFNSYKNEILDRLIPEDEREDIEESRSLFIEEIIAKCSKNATETIEFLKNADNQMPIDTEWMDKYGTFLDFLIDMENIQDSMFYKYEFDDEAEYETTKNNYYNINYNNMNQMLKEIDNKQKYMSEKICKKSLFSQLIKKIKSKD